MLISGCSESALVPTPPTTAGNVTTTRTDSRHVSSEDISDLTIVLGFQGQAEYVAAARANPDSDLGSLFEEYVVQPYWQQCAEGGEYEALAERGNGEPRRTE